MNGNRESYFNDQFGSYFKRWSDKVFTPGRCTTNKDELKQLKEIKDEFNFFLSSFFSYTVFFDHEKKETDPNNYYMEREWRILGKLDFNISDVHRVLMPVGYLRRFNSDIPDYSGHVLTVDKAP